MCGSYSGQNKGKMPATIDELKKFAKRQGTDPGSDLFVSSRDNEPFVVVSTVKMTVPGVGDKKIALHEKTGVGGRRYVAYTTVEVEEVSDSRFQELMSDK